MTSNRTRQFLGTLVGLLTLLAAALGPAQVATASTEISQPEQQVADYSDEQFIDYAMSEGLYEVDSDGSITIYDTRSQRSAEGTSSTVAPSCIACMEGKWKIVSTSGPTTTYGPWKTEASGRGPGTLSRTVTTTVSNGYTGTLSVSKGVVSSAVGFSITASKSVSSTYTGELKSGKTGKLQTRPVYKRYSVKQQYIKLGKVTKTTWVYPKKYVYMDHRIAY